MESLNISEWKVRLSAFAKERDWEKFHTPKNLAMALSVEASELCELLQWHQSDESVSEEVRASIANELSDILVYLLRMATVLNINMENAIENKMVINAAKYPAEKVYGSSKKYTQY